MGQDKTNSPSWGNLIHDFTQDTTLHGFRYLTLSSVFLLRRVVWAVLIMAAFVLFVYIVVMRFIEYFTFDITVSVQLLSGKSLFFPAVTICNENLLRATPVHELGLYDTMVYKFNSAKLEQARFQNATQVCTDEFTRYVDVTKTVVSSDDVANYVGVTVDVCLEICVKIDALGCNGFIYNRKRKSCTVIKDYFNVLPDGVLTAKNGYDFYRRTRCESAKDIRCTFDSGLCDFTQDTTDGTDWIRSQETTPTPLTGPDYDHTIGAGVAGSSGQQNNGGSFLYIRGDAARHGRLVSPLIIPSVTSPRCVEFYYYLYGEEIGSLALSMRNSNGATKTIWQMEGNQGRHWWRGFVRLGSEIFQLIFEGRTRDNDRKQRNHVAIDDIRIADCSLFDEDCLIRADGTGYRGTTAVTRTGQPCAHWETVARSRSVNFFTFPGEGPSSAFNHCRNPGGARERPWCYTDDLGSDWDYCDISFCVCDENAVKCANGKCVPRQRLCDGNNDCGDYSDETIDCELTVACDFETNFHCGYQIQKTSSRYVWTQHKGQTSSPDTGPIVDHTLQSTSGTYMLAQSLYGQEGDVTKLTSPPVVTSSVSCLTFFTHTFGKHVGQLNIYFLTTVGEQFRLLVVQSGVDDWVQQNVTIDHDLWVNNQEAKRVVFEAVRGNGISGDIAIDDITLTSGACVVPACGETEHMCRNSRCIPQNQVCDGQDNCFDGSEENDPCVAPVCDFEGPAKCGYKVMASTVNNDLDYTWSRVDATNPDSTASGFSVGHYMYVNALTAQLTGSRATLYSPWVDLQSTTCFHFYVWLGDTVAGIMLVYTREQNSEATTLHKVFVGPQEKVWLPSVAEVVVESSNKTVRLEFVSIMGVYGGSVGLDDVNITHGPCDKSKENISCTFEDPGSCGYQVLYQGSQFTWQRAEAGQFGYAPSRDVTLDQYKQGFYLTVRANVISAIRMAYIVSPWQQIHQTSCLRFYYRMRGAGIGLFFINYQHRNLFLKQLFSTRGIYRHVWLSGELTLPAGDIRIVIQAERGFDRYTIISVDEVTLSAGACPQACGSDEFSCGNGRCVKASVTCDGHDDCLDGTDETQAQCDTTCLHSKSGHFYMGDTEVTKNGVSCISWTRAPLNFTDTASTQKFPDADLASIHNYCRNPDEKPEGPWCFTHPDGSWDYCDIRSCDCKANQFRCGIGDICVSLKQVNDGKTDCPDGSDEASAASITCDFEDDSLCGYLPIIKDRDEFQWVWYTGSTASSRTGPSSDHTTGNSTGFYMFTEASGFIPGAVALLLSPIVNIQQASCLTVHYFLYGEFIESLAIERLHADGTLNLVDTLWWSQGQVWHNISYSVPAGTYGILFTYVKGFFFTSDAAIDDIILTTGLCSDLTACSSAEFTCDNGRCVSLTQTCDGNNDCGDYSDEVRLCDHSCLRDNSGASYRGTKSTTISGRTCAFWKDALPADRDILREHFRVREESIEDAQNYCRNPDGKDIGLWCYVSGETNVTWEYCDVSMCLGFKRCGRNQFECSNKRCVSRDVECDGRDDCGDGSDENDPCDGTRTRSGKEECKLDRLGTDYDGNVSVTITGHTCRPWSEVSESNRGTLSQENLVNGSNYCRNPSGGHTEYGGPFCYTEDSDLNWKYCDIPYCEGSLNKRTVNCTFSTSYLCGYKDISTGKQRWKRRGLQKDLGVDKFDSNPIILHALELDEDTCYFESTLGADYQGTVSTTSGNFQCQRWNSFTPRIHSYTDDKLFPDANRTAARNYCRNPGADRQAPYCYTLNGNKRIDFCDIPTCELSVMMAPPADGGSDDEPAVLISPIVDPRNYSGTDCFCVSFHFMMTGTNLGSLTLFAQDEVGHRRQLWQHFGDNAFKWDQKQISFTNVTGSFSLVFVSRQGYSPRSVALASVEVTSGKCLTDLSVDTNRTVTCPVKAFYCSNGLQCIDMSKVCDGYAHCEDTSDEIGCECGENKFQCGNGRCISVNLVANGQDDCLDNSDEEAPSTAPPTPASLTGQATQEVVFNASLSNVTVSVINSTYRLTKPELAAYDGDTFMSFLWNASHQVDDFIHECLWESVPCPSGYMRQQPTDYGMCYTFNDPAHAKVLSSNNKGTRYGLRLVLNVEQYETTPVLRDVAGVKLYLHDQGQVAQVKNLGFSLAPGMSFLVNVHKTMLSNLSPPRGRCGSRDLAFFPSYSMSNCEAECEYNTTQQLCSCMAPYMQTRNRYTGDLRPYCSFDEYVDCFLAKFEYTVNTSHSSASCGCPPSCDQVFYQPVISFSALTEQTAADILASGNQALEKKFLQGIETEDRVNKVQFVAYLEVFLGILDGFQFNQDMWTQAFEKIRLAVSSFLDMYGRDHAALSKTLDSLQQDYDQNMKGWTAVLNESISLFRSEIYSIQYSSPAINLTEGLLAKATLVQSGFASFLQMRDDWLNGTTGHHPDRVFIKTEESRKGDCEQIIADLLADIAILQNESGVVEGRSGADPRKNPTLLNRLSMRAAASQHCLGDYFRDLARTTDVFATCRVERFQTYLDQLDEIVQHYDLREQTVATGQNQRLVRQVVLAYLGGQISKLGLAGRLSDSRMSKVISDFTYFFTHFETRLLQEQAQTIHSLEDDAKICYSSIVQAVGEFEFFFERNRFTDLENMEVWLRPLVSLSNSFIDTRETNTKATVFKNFGGSLQSGQDGSENSRFIASDAINILDEHITSYFHGIELGIDDYTDIVRSTRERLLLALESLRYLLATFRTNSELNEEYIRTNYMVVHIFYSDLTYQDIKQLPALSEEDLMGNVGGYMGLLLGGSLMSLIELLDLIIYNFFVKAKQRVSDAGRRPAPSRTEAPPVSNNQLVSNNSHHAHMTTVYAPEFSYEPPHL